MHKYAWIMLLSNMASSILHCMCITIFHRNLMIFTEVTARKLVNQSNFSNLLKYSWICTTHIGLQNLPELSDNVCAHNNSLESNVILAKLSHGNHEWQTGRWRTTSKRTRSNYLPFQWKSSMINIYRKSMCVHQACCAYITFHLHPQWSLMLYTIHIEVLCVTWYTCFDPDTLLDHLARKLYTKRIAKVILSCQRNELS